MPKQVSSCIDDIQTIRNDFNIAYCSLYRMNHRPKLCARCCMVMSNQRSRKIQLAFCKYTTTGRVQNSHRTSTICENSVARTLIGDSRPKDPNEILIYTNILRQLGGFGVSGSSSMQRRQKEPYPRRQANSNLPNPKPYETCISWVPYSDSLYERPRLFSVIV